MKMFFKIDVILPWSENHPKELKIEFEIVNFLSGDFGNGRAENS